MRSRSSCVRKPRRNSSAPDARTSRRLVRPPIFRRMVRLITAVGARVISFLIYIGEIVVLAAETFASIVRQKIRWRLFLQQIVEMGLRSQSVVVITGAFHRSGFCRADILPIQQARDGLGRGRGRLGFRLSRAWARLDRADGHRPSRRIDVGGDRHDESDGTNRRLARAGRAPDRLSRRAAGARDDALDAAPGRGVCRASGLSPATLSPSDCSK